MHADRMGESVLVRGREQVGQLVSLRRRKNVEVGANEGVRRPLCFCSDGDLVRGRLGVWRRPAKVASDADAGRWIGENGGQRREPGCRDREHVGTASVFTQHLHELRCSGRAPIRPLWQWQRGPAGEQWAARDRRGRDYLFGKSA